MISFRMINTAIYGLWSHRQRAIFSILAVAISVSSIVFLLSVVQGFRNVLVGQVQSVGVQEIIAAPEKLFNFNKGIMNAGLNQLLSITSISSTLTYKDVLAVQKHATMVNESSPQYEEFTQASAHGKHQSIILTGTTHAYPIILHYSLQSGRFITHQDLAPRAKVAVLGNVVAKQLFGKQNPIGQNVTLKGIVFKVIGVMKPKETVGFNFDERVYIPITTMQMYTNVKNAALLLFQAKSIGSINQAMTQIKSIIVKRHGANDFGLLTPVRAEHMVNLIMELVSGLMVGVSSISFLVGGIGIMNVMLLSVKERTREIGVRKAIGASSTMVLLQFLLEAVFISVIGSIVGIGLSYGGLYELHHFFSVIPAIIPVFVIKAAVLFSIAFGVVFGLYPAFRATRVQPVDALRYE